MTKEEKLEIFYSPMMKIQSKISQAVFYHALAARKKNNNEKFQIPNYVMNYNIATTLFFHYTSEYPEEYKFAERANRAIRKKTNRLRKNLSRILNFFPTLSFVTFTLTDDALNSTSESTRRKKLQRLLKSLNCPSFFCLAYSTRHKREHYHALIASDINELNWPYGLVDIRKIISDIPFNLVLFEEDNHDKMSNLQADKILRIKDLQIQIRKLTRYLCNQSYEASILKDEQTRVSYCNRDLVKKLEYEQDNVF